jgi:hypothetical protein
LFGDHLKKLNGIFNQLQDSQNLETYLVLTPRQNFENSRGIILNTLRIIVKVS